MGRYVATVTFRVLFQTYAQLARLGLLCVIWMLSMSNLYHWSSGKACQIYSRYHNEQAFVHKNSPGEHLHRDKLSDLLGKPCMKQCRLITLSMRLVTLVICSTTQP